LEEALESFLINKEITAIVLQSWPLTLLMKMMMSLTLFRDIKVRMTWAQLMVGIRTITRHKFQTIKHSLPRTKDRQIIALGSTEETCKIVRARMASSMITKIQKRGTLREDPDERDHPAAREGVVLGEAEVGAAAEEAAEIREPKEVITIR
jgi:predicted membrane chloride channel (bestrophin family)